MNALTTIDQTAERQRAAEISARLVEIEREMDHIVLRYAERYGLSAGQAKGYLDARLGFDCAIETFDLVAAGEEDADESDEVDNDGAVTRFYLSTLRALAYR